VNRYITDHRNQVHQFFVAPSKHLYRTSTGELKSQDKEIESKLATVESNKKDILIHYVVADHFSSVLYGESYSSRDFPSPSDFLTRAWSQKEHTLFCGLPDMLTLPKDVEIRWPELRKFAEDREIHVIAPTSGFHAGIHHVKKWEKEILMWGIWGKPELSSQQRQLNELCQKRVNDPAADRGYNSPERWKNGIEGVQKPTPALRFL
jgi:hypothetical protein